MVSGGQDSKVYLEILEKEFAMWQSSILKGSPETIDGQTCEIGQDCKF
jgi:hypothetical protein